MNLIENAKKQIDALVHGAYEAAAAKGESTVSGMEYIERGYENLVEK